jgi:hypothetical protein
VVIVEFAMLAIARCAAILFSLALVGCDLLGLPDPAKEAAVAIAEGKAVDGACRHARRALEDCYTLNPKAQKAGVFTGWKEMHDYMREHKIDVVEPRIPRDVPPTKAKIRADAKTAEPKSADTGKPPAEGANAPVAAKAGESQ